MRHSKTLAHIRNGEAARICTLGHFIPAYVCHAAQEGFDCIWLDMEHRCFDVREIQTLLAYCHLYDIDCMLRPPTLEKTGLYRLLEDGATGLLIPHVSTPEKAELLVDAVKFPPIGDRGLDNAGLDSDFLSHEIGEYVDHTNRETFLVVQIETEQAVENVNEIASVDGVDGLFVGPGDLGLRLSRGNTSVDLEDAISCVAESAERHHKAWGLPVSSVEELQRRRSQGAQLLAHGGDFGGLRELLQRSARNFDHAFGEER